MKRKISIWLGLVWAIVFLVGCGSNQKNIQTVVESYFDSLTSGNFDDTQQYLNEKYDYTENDYLDINDIEILKNIMLCLMSNIFQRKLIMIQLWQN